MTLEQDWVEPPSATTDQTPPDIVGLYKEKPLFVKVVNTQNQRNSPEFTGWRTFSLIAAGSGPPVQLCQRRYHRYKAKFIWTIPASTIVYINNVPDSISNPTPAPTIAQLAGPLTSWTMPDYDGEQAVYAVFTGPGPVTVTVIDESYGAVQ